MNAFRNLNRPVAQAFDKEIIKVEKFVITGGKPLHGEVTISGAKNAAVGILPATILAADVCVIENLPDISDVAVSLKILSTLGAQVKMLNRNTYEIDTTHLTGTNVPDDLSRQMRASYYFWALCCPALAGRRWPCPAAATWALAPSTSISRCSVPWVPRTAWTTA